MSKTFKRKWPNHKSGARHWTGYAVVIDPPGDVPYFARLDVGASAHGPRLFRSPYEAEGCAAAIGPEARVVNVTLMESRKQTEW